jgi:hypothetical protein
VIPDFEKEMDMSYRDIKKEKSWLCLIPLEKMLNHFLKEA